MESIPQQTRLPLKVALDIVMQGIRIRLGRSLVTVSGVVLGVAFLMSILAGMLLKSGVAHEDALRVELNRMRKFLEAESGIVAQKKLGLVVLGAVTETETRFLEVLRKAGVDTIRVYDPHGHIDPAASETLVATEAADLATDASGILLMGKAAEGPLVLPEGMSPSTLLARARQPLLAATNPGVPLPETPGIATTRLSRELKPEEIAAREAQARRDRFRDVWIIVISLLVTVIGIANAMLMSVTERFREIGTMKCLGALSSFVRSMFLIESAIMGLTGGIFGALGGILFSILAYLFTYGPSLVFAGLADNLVGMTASGLFAVVVGVVLSMIAALYPANVAARMIPAVALRSNV